MDDTWMQRALALAALGEGDVHPNPLVGAVVVRDDRIVGRGYHRRCGGPHAEVYALDEAGDDARGATLYVTLEPCCHHGRTPPCTDRIIAAGVRRVVIATRDPNPQVDGGGVEHLRAAGIDVTEGILAAQAEALNEIFFTYIRRGAPFVQLKLAISLDGRIATRAGDARWISSAPSRIEAHRLRRRFMAIAVGVGTVIADDPRLTVRHVVGPDPVPIVLDRAGRLPPTARLLQGPIAPIVATASMPPDVEAVLAERGARIWRLRDSEGAIDLAQLLARLGSERIDSVLIEGGGDTAAHFLAAGLVDKLSWFVCPLLIGGRDAIPAVGGVGSARIADALRLKDVSTRWVGPDLLYEAYPVRNEA